jgi:hypothetical protein
MTTRMFINVVYFTELDRKLLEVVKYYLITVLLT